MINGETITSTGDQSCIIAKWDYLKFFPNASDELKFEGMYIPLKMKALLEVQFGYASGSSHFYLVVEPLELLHKTDPIEPKIYKDNLHFLEGAIWKSPPTTIRLSFKHIVSAQCFFPTNTVFKILLQSLPYLFQE